MIDRQGLQLGNYRILRPIGHGDFADVSLGEHIHLQTQVAIKLLHMRLAEAEIEGFLNEARTNAHLVPPHILCAQDFGIEGGTRFLVMDYASGGTLSQRLPKGHTLAT
jgi:serine/threonine protein kinase